MKGNVIDTIYDDTDLEKKIDRIILRSGKLCYNFITRCEKNKIGKSATPIISTGQLYPLDDKSLNSTPREYKSAKKFMGCKEDP